MNKRIRDLIESTDPDIYDKLEGNTLDEFLEKFADSLIEECVEYYCSMIGRTSEPHTQTLEHFGVIGTYRCKE